MSQLMMTGIGTHVTGGAPPVDPDFVMTVTTLGATEGERTFTLPTRAATFDYNVDWGDGSDDDVAVSTEQTHIYASEGTYTIRISGTFPRMAFNNGGSKLWLKTVENLGDVGWTHLDDLFWGCANLTSFTVGNTDLSGCNDTQGSVNFLRGCASMTTCNLTGWGGCAVKRYSFFISACTALTSIDVSPLDTSASTSFESMFAGMSGLTSDLDVSSLDVSACTTFKSTFSSLIVDVDVSGWLNAQNGVTLFRMFDGATGVTTIDLSGFTGQILSLFGTFENTDATTIDVSSLDTSACISMGGCFSGSACTTADISGWDLSSIDETDDLSDLMLNTSTTTAIYDAALIYWDTIDDANLIDNLTPNFGSSIYTKATSAGATARANLIANNSWVITDGGPSA